jgi:hypothetical protein
LPDCASIRDTRAEECTNGAGRRGETNATVVDDAETSVTGLCIGHGFMPENVAPGCDGNRSVSLFDVSLGGRERGIRL